MQEEPRREIDIHEELENSSLISSSFSESPTKDKTYWVAFLITFPVFMGYACCFSLQKDLSLKFGLTEGVAGTKLSKIYGVGVSFVYFFNLIFRVLGHNIIFGFMTPRNRVICALVSVIIGMTMLSYFGATEGPHHVAWVFVAYSFVGVCEGSYGPNMLNIVNHLGDTRLWVILAMPSGVATITILGFGLKALGVPFWALYIATAVIAVLSIVLYLFTVYPASKEADKFASSFDLRQFGSDLKEIKNWFPKIWLHSIVFIVNMVCLAMFNPGCVLYAYHSRVTYNMFGFTISQDWFMFIYNTAGFCGDFFSRRVMNKKKIINPIWYFFLLVFAFALNIVLIPEIAPFAAFGFNWANGGLYCQSTKLIGQLFTDRYHLTATSVWLFLGDCGSTSGSNLIQPVRAHIAELKSKMF